jgi:hypothetical protein
MRPPSNHLADQASNGFDVRGNVRLVLYPFDFAASREDRRVVAVYPPADSRIRPDSKLMGDKHYDLAGIGNMDLPALAADFGMRQPKMMARRFDDA